MLMRYIRHYDRAPKPIKWTYRDPSLRISLNTMSLLQATRLSRAIEGAMIYDPTINRRPFHMAVCLYVYLLERAREHEQHERAIAAADRFSEPGEILRAISGGQENSRRISGIISSRVWSRKLLYHFPRPAL